ncbi:MAG: hypothetical protein GY761_02325 [Hyphomicrobiales bacterium]|nr:hypothetical protein [Hyphomicrobiales bacterium]
MENDENYMGAFGREGDLRKLPNANDPYQIMEAELSNDENLIWVGKPVSIIRHAKDSIPIFVFGFLFFGFAMFMVGQYMEALRRPVNSVLEAIEIIFPIFFTPFILAGLVMLILPLWKMNKARHMIYALTDKRLIIRETFPRFHIESWPLHQVIRLRRRGPANGPGDVFFAQLKKRGGEDGAIVKDVGFIGIAKPRRVEDHIRELIMY